MRGMTLQRKLNRLSARLVGLARRAGRFAVAPDPVAEVMRRVESQAVPGLEGQVVVVTGSSRGIGLAVASALARRGARVVLNGRDAAAVEKAVLTVRAAGGACAGVPADVSTPAGADALLSGALASFGCVDVLINNAAVSGPVWTRATELSAEEWRSVLGVNLDGAFFCARSVAAWMVQNGRAGRIVGISSGVAQAPMEGLAAYGTSKAALEALTRYLARDLDGTGVSVCCLALGSHRTDMTRGAFRWEEHQLLPPPELAAGPLLALLGAPPGMVHGRTLCAPRLLQDPGPELTLNQPAAGLPSFLLNRVHEKPEFVARWQGRQTVLLDLQENQQGLPPAVASMLRRAPETQELWRYPQERAAALRSALAEELGLPPEAFVFGNGSTELVDRMLRAFVRPGEDVISNSPSWFLFDRFCGMHGIFNRKVPVRRPPEHDWDHNLQGILKSITYSTRLVYLVSPSNPLGTVLLRRPFEAFLAAVPPHVLVVIDEAYLDFCDREDALRSHEVAPRAGARFLALRTFSKFFGLASFRIGYAFGTPAEVDAMERMEIKFNVSALSQAAAVAALGDRAYRQRTLDNTRRERRRVMQALEAAGLAHTPSEAGFITVEHPTSRQSLFDRLEERGIVLPRTQSIEFILLPLGLPEQNDRYLEVMGLSGDGP